MCGNSMKRSLKRMLEPAAAAAVSLIVIAAAFYPAVFQHKLIFSYCASLDALDLNIPRRFLAVQSLLKHGEVPLWEPSIGCGVPLFAESEAGVFHPTLLFFFLDDLTLAANLMILSAILIAVLGSYAWGRCLGLSPLASGIGAVAYGFCKIMLLRTAGLNMLHVLAWLPGSMAVIHKLASTGRKRWWFCLTAIWTCQLLASHMQMFVVCQMCCWLYICFVLLTLTPQTRKTRLKLFGFFLLAIGFAAALGAAQLFATQELVQKSVRSSAVPSMTMEELEFASPSWKTLPVFINPFYNCRPFVNSPDSFQYFGLIPLLLCLISINKKRVKAAIALWTSAVLFLLISMGTNGGIYLLLYKCFPYMSSFRFPGRFGIAAVLFMSILASLGAQNLYDWLTERYQHRLHVPRICLVLLLLLTCLDLGYINMCVHSYVSDSWQEKPAVLAQLGEYQRVYSPYSLYAYSPYEFYWRTPDGMREFDCQEAVGQHKCLLSSGISSIYGIDNSDDYSCSFYGIVLTYSCVIHDGITGFMDRVLSMDEHSVGKIAPDLDNWFRMQAVSHIVTPMPLPKGWPESEFSEVQSVSIPEIPTSRVYVYKLANPVSKVRLVPVLQTDPPANCVDLERSLQIHIGSLYEPDFAHPADIGEVTAEKYTNNSLTVLTNCDRDAYLVISQSYDSNWHAAVDGQPVPISLTNLDMQSLPVPKGRHRVELRYVSPAFEKGWKISLAALIVFILLGIGAACRSWAASADK